MKNNCCDEIRIGNGGRECFCRRCRRGGQRFAGLHFWAGALARTAFWGWMLGPVAVVARAQTRDLTEIGIESLMEIQVTSVSKKEQKLFQAPAAIYVISAEDMT